MKAFSSKAEQDIEDHIGDFSVYEVDGAIHGCAALHIFSGKQAEIAGVAVDETYASLGIGKKLVEFLIAKAVKLKLRQAFVLTTQTADWFSQLGFVKASLSDLPEEKQASYNMKRNSLILTYKLSSLKSKKPLAVE